LLVASVSAAMQLASLVDKTGLAHPGLELVASPPAPRASRAPRPRAPPSAITASFSLAAPDLDDSGGLQLHAEVMLAEGGCVRYSTSGTAQSIFWKDPMAGDYSIVMKPSEQRRSEVSDISFRVVLAGENQKAFTAEGFSTDGAVECFRFTVGEDGVIHSCQMLLKEAEAMSEDEASTRAPSDSE